jgi:hypothetical protein
MHPPLASPSFRSWRICTLHWQHHLLDPGGYVPSTGSTISRPLGKDTTGFEHLLSWWEGGQHFFFQLHLSTGGEDSTTFSSCTFPLVRRTALPFPAAPFHWWGGQHYLFRLHISTGRKGDGITFSSCTFPLVERRAPQCFGQASAKKLPQPSVSTGFVSLTSGLALMRGSSNTLGQKQGPSQLLPGACRQQRQHTAPDRKSIQ